MIQKIQHKQWHCIIIGSWLYLLCAVTCGYSQTLNERQFERIVIRYVSSVQHINILFAIAEHESQYGLYQGSYCVLVQLAKQYANARSLQYRQYMLQQIMALNKISKMTNTNILSFRGSISGAIGYMQIMPITFLLYMQDGNNDGQKDPRDSHDSVATAAYKFAHDVADVGTKRAILKYNNSTTYARNILANAKRR